MAPNKVVAFLLLGILSFAQAGVTRSAEQDGAKYMDIMTLEQARSMEEDFSGEKSRILLGQSAPEGLLPWQVHLRLNRPDGLVASCGGSIIHSQWVLTAAHCTEGMVRVIVRMGINVTTPRLVLETPTFYIHPDYSSRTLNHDLSLIDLGRDIEFNAITILEMNGGYRHRETSDNLQEQDYIQPISIQSALGASQGFSGLTLRASGYGLTNSSALGGVVSETLNYVDMRGTSMAECSAVYGSTTVIYSTVCTMAIDDPQQSTCSGDSGGPLVLYEQVEGEQLPRPTLVGVVCFVSSAGCHTDNPAGYVTIGFYHPWLQQVTGMNFAS